MNTTGRILVVDDDAGGRRLTRATLTRAGFKVSEAPDGEKALEAMRAELPDLVLMDVSMPVMDGFTACAELRKLPGGNRVPVVMMTGLDDVQSIERAFEVGATDFITKPINWPILAHRVRYMLRASSAINDLKQNQRRLSNAQRIGEMGDWEWDVPRDRIVPSEQAWRIFGHDAVDSALQSDSFLAAVHPEDAARVRQACEQAIAKGGAFAIEHRVLHSGGHLRHVHQQVEVIAQDDTGRALRLAGAVHDITQRKDAEEQIRRLAYYDTLTGLPNRLLFTEQLHKTIAKAEQTGQQVAIMFVDLDHFKRVNDTLGHGAGDELLRVVSGRLASSIRSLDSLSRGGCAETGENSIARLGGDEFIVMLSDVNRVCDAAGVARRLVAALNEPVTVMGTELFVGGSVGVAMYPTDGTDIDTLLMNADTAMYRAKEAGRGGFQFYDRSMNARALERLVMETSLRRALDREEFVLHYQPRIELATGRIVGAEALIRWQNPERGMVPPDDFIPLAETTGLVIPIGEWAIAAVCRQGAAWRAAGLEIPIAVNLAATHLREQNLPDLVARNLREHGLPASLLEIEVTESILMVDPEQSVANAVRLKDIGVGLSIDDFGTGYSSLSYLKRLPITSLKIDRSFVRDIATDPDDAAIIIAVIAMAHTLKLRVVAEGVETQAQWAFLKAHGCDEFQGFLVSRPVDVIAFARLLEQQRLSLEVVAEA
jgi:diguanylate cyclase (GGDEF)-like protein/PAS domain S-box-containing protein